MSWREFSKELPKRQDLSHYDCGILNNDTGEWLIFIRWDDPII